MAAQDAVVCGVGALHKLEVSRGRSLGARWSIRGTPRDCECGFCGFCRGGTGRRVAEG